ncbi:dr1-associated corepressor isoform 2-T2 [Pholidichthys leucotaenia]
MPRQKRRYNVRFPPKRIKKIMQKDTEVGRIAMAVPVIIARALEMFLKSLLTKTCLITESKFSPVVSVAHMKQCIESEKHFHFLKDLVDQSTSTTKQMDNRGTSMWPLYRTRSSTSACDCGCRSSWNCCSLIQSCPFQHLLVFAVPDRKCDLSHQGYIHIR